MEAGIVHHDDAARLEAREQHLAEPGLEELRIHRSLVLHRGDGTSHAQAGDKPRAPVPPARGPTLHGNPLGRPRVRAVQEAVYPRLVDIDERLRKDSRDGVRKGFPQPLVTLGVAHRLFFRVTPNLFNAFRTAVCEQANLSASSVE